MPLSDDWVSQSVGHKGLPAREGVVQIFFSIGGYFGGFHKVLLKKRGSDNAVCAFHNEWGEAADECAVRTLQEKDWDQVLGFLYDKMHIGNWKSEYYDNDVLDGTQWDFCLAFADGSEIEFSGSNDYPPMFEKLESVFEKLYRATNKEKAGFIERKNFIPLFSDVQGIADLLSREPANVFEAEQEYQERMKLRKKDHDENDD